MTSSIFLPRMSRAWPEPSTHLTASTMFVLPEPFGPTMAVTPPSNWISVCRAKVLKPSNCRDLRNKTSGQVSRCRGQSPLTYQGCLIDRFAELAAAQLRHRHDLGLDRCGGRGGGGAPLWGPGRPPPFSPPCRRAPPFRGPPALPWPPARGLPPPPPPLCP